MSSTNRGGKREVSDYYFTPTEPIIHFLKWFTKNSDCDLARSRILDPCAGGSSGHPAAYPLALREMGATDITTFDIRLDSCAEFKRDYLQQSFPDNKQYDLVITNPPFSHALPIIQKALADTREGGYVVMLLRLNFFGSKKRLPFFHSHMAEMCFVHSKRIKFHGTKKTDSIEYMHCIWRKGVHPEFCKTFVG